MPSLTRRSLPVLDASGALRKHGGGAAPPRSGSQSGSGDSSLWRSLAERARGLDRAQAAAEFPPGAAEAAEGGTSRRSFVQLLGASVALAGLGGSGCLKQPDEKILPYTRQPEEVVPGNPLHYATASTIGGYATGLLVTSNEGRPTKIEGNPEHSASRGASGIFEQASVLQLYDPHRASVVKHKGADRSWREFLAAQAERAKALRAKDGAGLRFLLEPSTSPLLGHIRGRLRAAFPKARFQSFAIVSRDEAFEGARLAFGAPFETQLDLSKARVIACLDADLLATFPGNLPHIRAFADGREPGDEMNRLYAAECSLSVTGMSADHRLRVRSSEIARLALALAAKLGARGGLLARFAPLASRAAPDPAQERWLSALAKDLEAAGPRGVVVAGDRQPALVHALVHAINAALGSAAVGYLKPQLHELASGPKALDALGEEIRAGVVDTLVISAHNPVYGAPAELNFGEALAKVPNSIYRGLHLDETAARASWFVPATHPLESWGDARAPDGTVTFVQPLISPLFNGVSEVEVLASFLGEGDRSAYTQLREHWKRQAPGPFESLWEKWLADGFIAGTAAPKERPQLRVDSVLAAAQSAELAPQAGLELNVVPDYKIWDGRFANNAWLQELPDPVTKLTWENAALVSPVTARELGVTTGDLVDLGLRGPPVHAPIYVLPGHADGAVTVALGYGRAGAEELARGVGFDTSALRHARSPWFESGLTVTPMGRKHPLAVTQEHWSMEGRDPAIETTLENYEEDERIEKGREKVATIHTPWDYSKVAYKWGMAIDLGRCTGCSACVVACQSENNIPVVGKDDVAKSREMHWLRIDRYFSGSESDPRAVVQPMMCVHCESAPCEYVCPVNATVHSDEGLNEMIYNRCVGTRYCSNNCPYKVRRFNFFSYTSEYSETEKLVMNPDVTVRSRGVMEKCTYCVQRIERARIATRIEERPLKDRELKTACEQACPAAAIVFGNLNDPGAAVTKLHQDERHYYVLNELGTRPRTAYLARVRNPNPELA